MLSLRPTKEIDLRPYQLDAVEGLRVKIREGKKRLILVAPTGAGKTVIASHLLRQADQKGSYALFMVDRVALVNQTSETLDDYGIGHGIVQGINERWMPRENVQVCSVQTLARRILPRTPSLIIYDECHAQYQATLAYIARHAEALQSVYETHDRRDGLVSPPAHIDLGPFLAVLGRCALAGLRPDQDLHRDRERCREALGCHGEEMLGGGQGEGPDAGLCLP
ncbi:DEAD/DEAH box helicase [Brevundimonas mediterranea]|uniref:DNA repair helicase RadD n=1 Tax=Brevundimonas mediterranea TaxID=74329 RepID=A0A7Z9C5C8_9CAUL|nr:DEAD/DEAH box helicase family protein [Brevundimonas mediterranea]VDC49726.1 Putative DNA repair helicase RadD [Brevundimonas mediterranea]